MISWLTGIVKSVDEASLVLLAGASAQNPLGGGVGYLIHASRRSLSDLSRGGEASLWIEMIVREDALTLFGFASISERDCFRLLTTVQGVGAKMAISLLSSLSPDDIRSAVLASDKTMLTRADGVGPKLAARIISELKDKLAAGLTFGSGAEISIGGATKTESTGANNNTPSNAAIDDAMSALANLGYGRAQAYDVLAKVSKAMDAPDNQDVSKLITAALKQLAG